ncbi:hypothetical protein [Blastomonas sp. SL216]|uniref:hypothetical protein n=1 Tax=Blastomonas sp. SL216 TaxID=2995169 RepID=UPI002377BD0D|nr:hypothetical protein OU999_04310 [Blastomonas sp. SL216]
MPKHQDVLGNKQWVARPKGIALRRLIDALAATGVHIKASSFDALAVPPDLDASDISSVCACLSEITFIEIKTANQPRVKAGFDGFFFALTENEIAAADALGARHRVNHSEFIDERNGLYRRYGHARSSKCVVDPGEAYPGLIDRTRPFARSFPASW